MDIGHRCIVIDPGVALDKPAAGAPEALARLAPTIGAWDFELEVVQPDQETLRSRGVAHVTYMGAATRSWNGPG